MMAGLRKSDTRLGVSRVMHFRAQKGTHDSCRGLLVTRTRCGRLSASQGSKPSPRANRGGDPNVGRSSVIDVRMVESRDRSESSCDSTRQLQDHRHGSVSSVKEG